MRSLKAGIGIVFIFALCAPAFGQVTCSPDVDKQMCKDVAAYLNALLPTVISTPISAAVVTPEEYKKQLIEFGEREANETNLLGGDVKAMNCPKCFSVFYRHTLSNTFKPDVTFIRNAPDTAVPDRILISSDALCGSEPFLVSDDPRYPKGAWYGRSTGKEDIRRVSSSVDFIIGYLQGATSTDMDHAGAAVLFGGSAESYCKEARPGSSYRIQPDSPIKVCGALSESSESK
jgi:hypothetical protein